MSFKIKCQFFLSKKLKAITSDNVNLTMFVENMKDGKGEGYLIFSGDENTNGNLEGMTSIQILPEEIINENTSEITQEDVNTQTTGSIFSTVPSKDENEPLVNKIAVVNAPEKRKVSTAIKSQKEIREQASIAKEIPSEECRKWITNIEQLMESIERAKNKKSSIDPNEGRNEREKLVLNEMKEKEESIDEEAYVVNEKYGSLLINDLDINLSMNEPLNLKNFSAKRLYASKDLKELIKQGFINFTTPEEAQKNIEKSSSQQEHESLDIFDNHEMAMSALSGETQPEIKTKSFVEEITEENINLSDPEEDEIINLTKSLPIKKEKSQINLQKRNTNEPKKENNKASVKSIRKLS